MKTIYCAGGCFWGTQRFFDQFDGVITTTVGYANGSTEHPTYQDVCRGSGHAETVKIEYDEGRLSTRELLRYYFLSVDPLSVNRQGHDTGVQYRTGVYYDDEGLLPDIRSAFAEEEQAVGQPIRVELKPLEAFYPAEEYHQKYLEKNPGGYCHLPQSLLNLKEEK